MSYVYLHLKQTFTGRRAGFSPGLQRKASIRVNPGFVGKDLVQSKERVHLENGFLIFLFAFTTSDVMY